MALPVTISGAAFVSHNYFCGSFKAPNSQYYVVILESTGSTPEVFMATDPTDSFAAQDSSNNPTAVPVSMWATLDGTDLHIATVQDANPELQYHVFHTATDLWDGTIINETVENIATRPATASMSCSITVRSDDDVIILYNGDTDADMGNPYQRVDYARRESGSWTAGIDVGGTSEVTENRIGSVIVHGSGDNMHFFWTRDHLSLGDVDVRAVSLDSSNNLSTERSRGIPSMVVSGHYLVNGIMFNDTGTIRITIPLRRETNPNGRVLLHTESSGALADNGTYIPVTDNSTDDVDLINLSPVLTSAVDNDGRMYVMWASENDNDLFRDDEAPPYNISDWNTDIEELNAVTINRISCNIYQRGANIRLAYVYDDGGTIKYNEVDLGAAPVVGGTLALTHRKYERHNLLR